MSRNNNSSATNKDNGMSLSSSNEPGTSHSTLNPSAPTFHYRNRFADSEDQNRTYSLNQSGGAVKKNNYQGNTPWRNKRNDQKRYGSGRTFNGFRNADFNVRQNFEHQRQHNDMQYNNEQSKYYADKPKQNHDQIDKTHHQSRTYKNNYNHEGYTQNNGNVIMRKNKKGNSAASDKKKLDAASQRERLEQMLNERLLECLVCCEGVKTTDKIWSCEQCYLILHLNCTLEWANSSKLENGWRCPACQNVTNTMPNDYKCYCGKILEPRPCPGVTPHSCGEMCMRSRRGCDHKCTILCHPGPCPDCQVMVNKQCGCGVTQQIVKCSNDMAILCGGPCHKPLKCGMHNCWEKCHASNCGDCPIIIDQKCYCGKEERRIGCSAEIRGAVTYSCGSVCQKLLSCSNHKCPQLCHEGDCSKCENDVDLVKTCPCGKTPLTSKRTSCLDPILCCQKICGKLLKCGQPSTPHTCKMPCHEGDCPVCPLTTSVKCRCGHMDKNLPCAEVTTKADDARCDKKCTKKRLCGKHRCNQRCCIEVEHVCPLPCNHLLGCGQHRCERTCHSGRCPSCMETSFDELYCECGSSVLYPPIPCGTKPPTCLNPCSRPQPCEHEAIHICHTGQCPPCTVLCKKWCYGKHEQRSAIPCHQEDFSCGLPCGRPMPCGNHKCIKPCHLGPCPLPCRQSCNIKRSLCGHSCNAPCHQSPCPDTNCKATVTITCQCGLLKGMRLCVELVEEYKQLEMSRLKDKIGDLMKNNGTVDLIDISTKLKKPHIFKILECNEECRVLERNRRLAIGLQIRNPDLSQKLTPRYSEFMRSWAKKDPYFCQKIHDKLTNLVQLSKQSKQKSRSYSFESMNRDKRTFVHEYCEHFGCESAAYDAEPNRNVVATAIKEKSWLPSMSLLEVIQRENGQRKVPGPVLGKGSLQQKSETSSSVALKIYKPAVTLPDEKVDYFDNPPM